MGLNFMMNTKILFLVTFWVFIEATLLTIISKLKPWDLLRRLMYGGSGAFLGYDWTPVLHFDGNCFDDDSLP